MLSEEARAPPNAPSALRSTILNLESLLDSSQLPEYKFKAPVQLATPPPDNSTNESNAPGSTMSPPLSRFAEMLLRKTDIAYHHPGLHASQHHSAPNVPLATQRPHQTTPRAPPHSASSTAVPSTAAPNAMPNRPGPTIMVKPLPPTARKEEYQRYDAITTGNDVEMNQKSDRANDRLSAMKPQEREVAEHNMKKLKSFVSNLAKERDDPDQSDAFTTLATEDGERVVLRAQEIRESEAWCVGWQNRVCEISRRWRRSLHSRLRWGTRALMRLLPCWRRLLRILAPPLMLS